MKGLNTGVPALVLAACIFLAAAQSAAGRSALVISQFPRGSELLRLDSGGEKGFSLSFIHSVSGTPVRDDYLFDRGRIVQVAERFMAHGAGLPSHPDEPFGLAWEREGDAFLLRMHRPIQTLVVRTDGNYRNRLILGRRDVNLNQWEDQALLIRLVTDTDAGRRAVDSP